MLAQSRCFPLLLQERTFRGQAAMSAPCQKATCRALFNHLVGASEERRRDVYAQCLGGLEIDNKFEPGYALNR